MLDGTLFGFEAARGSAESRHLQHVRMEQVADSDSVSLDRALHRCAQTVIRYRVAFRQHGLKGYVQACPGKVAW